jgi:hypothetical protein
MPDPAGVNVSRSTAAPGAARGVSRLPGPRVGLLPSAGFAPAGLVASAAAIAVSPALPLLSGPLVAPGRDWLGRG